MTAQRQSHPHRGAIALCPECRSELRCPRCDAPALVRELPPQKLALTITEACEALGISDTTLRQWEVERGLPVLRLAQTVRIPVGPLEDWLRAMAGGR